ncbi:MAG: hypothetical protein HYV07_01050 [Deltaproteobacteria bacterium]|nr:hypothetical protein [Deltaproteobacteria bacterium]
MAKKKAEQKKAEPRDTLVVKSKVKEYIRGKELRCQEEVLDALSDAVYGMLDRAAKRAQENDRKTVRPADL